MAAADELVVVALRGPAPTDQLDPDGSEAWCRAALAVAAGPVFALDLVLSEPDDADPPPRVLVLADGRSAEAALDVLTAEVGPERANRVRASAWAYRSLGAIVRRGGAPDTSVGPLPGAVVYLLANNALPGREDELHRWYDDVHLEETFRHLDVLAARRFWSRSTPVDAEVHDHLVAYEVGPRGVGAQEQRRLALAAERAEALAAGRTPAVAVPAAVTGPRWAAYFEVRPL
jgi:hypothetical protein